jgi:DNA-binding MarR family transcriptional regulator
MAQPFPDDELRRLLGWLVRGGGLLERHDHDGIRASTSEVFALGELVDAGPLSQQQLGERLGLEKSTVSRLAAGLERRGWLERVRDPANRRFYRLALTPAGVAAAEQIGTHLTQQHQHLFAELTEQERAGLMLGMSGLSRAIEQHHRQHHHDHRPAAEGGRPAAG